MITKFERKVIAGLTAFLMCLSMRSASSKQSGHRMKQ